MTSTLPLATTDQLLQENSLLKQDIQLLKKQLDWFKQQLFGQKSERRLVDIPAEQGELFGNTNTRTELDAPTEEIKYTRKQKQRNDAITDSGLRFDESVTVEEIRMEVPELKGDNADQYIIIDEHITYRLAQRPSSYVVLKYIQPVIKRKDTQVITTKSAPAAVFEKSMADVSFITGLIVDKFLYHLPLYRQHQKLRLSGITVSRATLTNYVNRAGMLLKPIHEAVVRSILQSKVLALDETPVKAGRNKKGKKPQHIKAGNKPGTGHCWATRMLCFSL